MNQTKYELNDQDLTFDFDEWDTLYKVDPEAFDARCLKWNKLIIDSAPDIYQRRLNGLLFQINMERERSKNAIDSCLRLSGLMWDKFNQLKLELVQLGQQPHTSQLTPSNPTFRHIEPAQVLTFPETEKLRKRKKY